MAKSGAYESGEQDKSEHLKDAPNADSDIEVLLIFFCF